MTSDKLCMREIKPPWNETNNNELTTLELCCHGNRKWLNQISSFLAYNRTLIPRNYMPNWKSIGIEMTFSSQFEIFDPTPLTFDPRPLIRMLVWHPNETYGWMQNWKMHILDFVWSRYDHFSGRYCENKNFGFSLTLTFDRDSPKTTSV